GRCEQQRPLRQRTRGQPQIEPERLDAGEPPLLAPALARTGDAAEPAQRFAARGLGARTRVARVAGQPLEMVGQLLVELALAAAATDERDDPCGDDAPAAFGHVGSRQEPSAGPAPPSGFSVDSQQEHAYALSGTNRRSARVCLPTEPMSSTARWR